MADAKTVYPTVTDEEIENRYTHHFPDSNQALKYEQLRKKVKELAREIVRQTPTSREQTRALNALDETLFLSCAAIARNS